MKRTKEQRLTKFWEKKINPVTGWVDDKRKVLGKENKPCNRMG